MGVERVKVASTSDFSKELEMQEVTFKDDDSKILLSKVNGNFHATTSKCTHYGAPLKNGVITSSGRIVCPWHGACFSAKTGDIEDAPAPRNLQSFKVEVDGSDIYVTADVEEIKKNYRVTKPAPKAAKQDSNGVVIVGGGSGALYAVEGLRESGYTGPVKVLSAESYMPIDRTKLSKALIDDAAKLAVREDSWYSENKIDFSLSTKVTGVDVEAQNVTTEDGKTVEYDHLILATGGSPIRIPVDGSDLGNVFLLRDLTHTKAINEAISAATKGESKPNVVIVGSSFIGMEVALAASKNANVTVVGMENAPFEKILGPEIGNALRKNHEKQGIKFYLPAELASFEPSKEDSSKVGSVALKSGEKIDAHVVILGTGVKPVTDYASKIPGIQLHEKDKSIEVDDQLRIKGIGKKNVYAIGDIARYPDVKTGEVVRVEHWNVAGNHGRSVANTIAGREEPFNKTALFWSAQGSQLRYCGNSRSGSFEDIHIDGKPEELKFVAYYGKGDEIVAVASMGRDPIVVHCSELYTSKRMPSYSKVKQGFNPLEVPLIA